MYRICDIPFKSNFYWNGKRYVQCLRPKNIMAGMSVYCYEYGKCDEDWIKMPSGRKIKPVARVNG